ncbi:MAG: hypothetical protein AAGD25_30645 [Cyanobacteria bacterium P01_F01_bin.150]
MITLSTLADADAYNQQSIRRLVRTLTLSQGDFTLMLAHCNYQELQMSMFEAILEECSLAIATVNLASDTQTLFTVIKNSLQNILPLGEEAPDKPDALMVFGLNRLTQLDQVLKATNLMRDEFRKQFHFPVVLWVDNHVLRQMIRLAPDFQNWSTTMDFQLATSQLLRALEDRDRILFSSLLDVGGGQFLPNYRIFGTRYRRELNAAMQDLAQRQESLSEDLAGTLAFVNGREAHAKATKERNLDQALGLYQQALDLYQESLNSWANSSDLKRQACVLYHMGNVWRAKGERYRAEHEACYETALIYFWRCIDTFGQINRQDYEARFINMLCFTLQRLNQRPNHISDPEQGQWDELEKWAGRSLELQQQFYDQFRMARAYGFLAEVAIARKRWTKAKDLAERAQAILVAELHNPDAGMASNTAVNLQWERYFHQGWYLLALGRASLALGETDAAIQHLRKAQTETKAEYDPELYIRILNQLRNIYFDQADYRTAFQLRQRRRAIEYQYNFRAFVGAGHLQPKHQITNPAMSTQTEADGSIIPSDFQTSGRQDDIETLVGRVASTNHRLTIIYGQSGVGKSSMLESGLVPTLQYNPIGTYDVMPIFQQVYTDADWDRSLFQSLKNSLRQFESIHLGQASPDTFDGPQQNPYQDVNQNGSGEDIPPGTDVVTLILDQLRWNSEHDIVTVLLFDQFEEFFFVCTQKRDRLRFYRFLKVCLNISFVNVMISLREDYLHRLLEMTREVHFDVINNDILGTQILHHIGNFSRERTKTVIGKLTEKTPFQFQSELIDRLVEDLSEETGDVSPIELQIVGTQMQTDRITTLHDYEEKGPKVKLVQRYLDEALTNCGPENKKMARNLLYVLTDENQMRPLKTLVELADDSGALPSQVELILDILVGTGMVVKFPESATHYYQLVHDYLVPFIRSDRQSENLLEQRLRLTKFQLNEAWQKEAQQRLRAELAEVRALNALSRALLLSHDQLGALLKGVEAAQKLIIVQYTHTEADGTLTDGTIAKAMKQAVEQIERDTVNRLRHTLGQVKEINRLEGHDAKSFAIAIHPDGQRLASVSADHTVRIWSLSGEAIASCEGHKDQVLGVAFSPDGQFLASTSADQTVKLWPSNGKVPIRTFSGHTDTVHQVVFHPYKPLLASASQDGTVRLWSTIGGVEHTFRRGTAVLDLAFSPDGEALVAGYQDGKIRIWRIDGTFIQEIKAHDREVYGVQYSVDGQAILSVSGDGTVKLWKKAWGINALSHTTHGKVLHHFHTPVLDIQMSPDGQLISITSSSGAVRLSNTKGQILQSFRGHEGNVHSVCFSPDGRLLVSTGDDKTIRLWNLDGIGLHVAQGHKGRIISAAFSRQSPQSPELKLATAGEDHTVKLWQLDGALFKTFHGHQDLVRQVCFSPDNQYLASASNDGTVKLWHVDGSLIQTFSHHYGGVRDVGFSPDGRYLISAGHDRIVRLWPLGEVPYKLSSTTQPIEFHGARARVLSIAMSPDGRLLAGASGRAVILWTVSANLMGDQAKNQSADELQSESVGQYHLAHAHNARVLSVCFSPDGQYLATAGADKVIKLWRRNGKWLRTLKGHQATVKQVCFSPDGQFLISYGSDRTVRVWRPNGKLVRVLRGHVGTICGMTLASSGFNSAELTGNLPGNSGDELTKHELKQTPITDLFNQRILSVGESAVVKGWQFQAPSPSEALANDAKAPINRSTTEAIANNSPQSNPENPKQPAEWEQPSIEFVLDAEQSILLSDSLNANLEQLVQQGCQWLNDYLSHNPCISDSDRQRCLAPERSNNFPIP